MSQYEIAEYRFRNSGNFSNNGDFKSLDMGNPSEIRNFANYVESPTGKVS